MITFNQSVAIIRMAADVAAAAAEQAKRGFEQPTPEHVRTVNELSDYLALLQQTDKTNHPYERI